MAQSFSSLDELLHSLKNNPQAVIVKKLREHGNVKTLTQVKLKLVDQCRLCKDFPKGDLFSRRNPKRNSCVRTLEERLAVDICELNAFTDSGIVTQELKNMFKPVSTDEFNITMNETDCETGKENIDPEKGCETPILVASQGRLANYGLRLSHEHCRESFAKLESAIHQIKETFNEDIARLNKLLEKQENLLKDQGDKISRLTKKNISLDGELRELRRANVLNQSMNKLDKNRDNSSKAVSLGINSGDKSGEVPRHEITDLNESEIEMPLRTINNEPNVSNTAKSSYCEAVKSSKPTECVMLSPLAPGHDNLPVSEQRSLYTQASKQKENISNADNNKNAVTKQNNDVLLRNEGEQGLDNREDGFVGVKRKRNNTRRFFLSGIDEKVSDEMISSYLNQRGIHSTFLKVFKSKRKGTVSAKLHVSQADSIAILQDNFWPKYVSCRSWLSKEKIEKANELGKSVGQVMKKSTLV